ncbi:MAG: YciI family protein [Phototrophicaceae bacterium]
MNQYVYTLEPAHATMFDTLSAAEQAVLADHTAYRQQLLHDEIAILVGASTIQDQQTIAMIFFEASDDEAANRIMVDDPAVSGRLMRACLYPHRMSLWNAEAFTLVDGQQHYFYKIRPTRPAMIASGATELEGKAMGEHFMYLKDLSEKGIFAFAGPTLVADNSNFGAGLLRADSLDAAWEISQNDPAVINRVMRLDIFPFTVMGYRLNFVNR